MIGSQILNYQIKSLIGDGGMGTVYMAEHVKLGRKVAIKVLHPHLASNESIRQRFVNEAKTMSELQHPNIVGLLDYHEDQFGLYLIMEYIDGIPLDEYIKNSAAIGMFTFYLPLSFFLTRFKRGTHWNIFLE
jgi:serine/threonine protein kinase